MRCVTASGSDGAGERERRDELASGEEDVGGWVPPRRLPPVL
jgi:hypothetical protein